MEKYNKIEFNAAIYPKVMSIILGKPVENSAAENIKNMEPELAVDLPRDVYLLYLQKKWLMTTRRRKLSYYENMHME